MSLITIQGIFFVVCLGTIVFLLVKRLPRDYKVALQTGIILLIITSALRYYFGAVSGIYGLSLVGQGVTFLGLYFLLRGFYLWGKDRGKRSIEKEQ